MAAGTPPSSVRTAADAPPGRELRVGIRRAFSHQRLLYAVRRLGMFPLARSVDVAEHLTHAPVFRDPATGVSVASLLVTAHGPGRGALPPVLMMRLELRISSSVPASTLT